MAELLYKEGGFEVRLKNSHSLVHQDLIFFHSNEFINREEKSNPLFFNLYRDNKNIASIVIEVLENEAISLSNSPFGGLIVSEYFDQDQVAQFLKIILSYCQEKKYILQIKCAPDCYHPYQKEIHKSFLNVGFLVNYTDTNQHIIVDELSFADKVNRNRKRKIVSITNQKLVFKKLDVGYLDKAYELITECRIDKGYPITMTLEALQNSFDAFPNKYILFGVFDKNEMIATAVSIRVSEKILYNFYHGDRLSHRQHDPVTLLVDGVYKYCQREGVNILDLGVSSDHGVLNEGLFYFKQSCGAVSSNKISYQSKV